MLAIRYTIRKATKAGIALALIAGTLSACGDSAEEISTSSAPPSTEAEASTTAAAETTVAPEATTRTVEHALGTSEVPVDPQRIVVVDRRGSLAFLLELGFEPVGALDASWLFGEPFHPLIAEKAEAAGVEPIDDTDGPNVEQIAALEPDLIIGNVRDMGETADLLAEIAPTIGLEWNFEDPIANAVTIGEALDRTEEAQALVAEFEESLAAAAADTADPGTVSIIGLFAIDDIRIYREFNLYGKLTQELGGQIVPTEAELALNPEDQEVNYVSMEEIGLANGDRVISLVNRSDEANAAYADLVAGPLVQALPAFQSGQVLVADPQLAFGAAGVTGLNAMLEQLVEFYNT